ncbi:glycoside hydrolase family 97 protein [Pseudokordiimonas caeni]|uniref:glycoside hydrolase family 97 protein n=1 Tax=Pseudokordiimonas caeni TaxID=2997908 RepID=UPI002811AA59|nr:glycoside hydrolase family 97 protein [Pseudokordiimonas caeni]
MKFRPFLMLSQLVALGAAGAVQAADRECAQSPGQVIDLCVYIESGQAYYEVSRKGTKVIAPSVLGLSFEGEPQARYTAIAGAKRNSADSTWEQPWGEQRFIRDNHTELKVTLKGDTPLNKAVDVTFRLFDDGFGLRYTYGAIPAGRKVAVTADRTEFSTIGNYSAWWYKPLEDDRDEYLYKEIDAKRITLAETPLTLRSQEEGGLLLAFHEAALVDFPSMLLSGDGAGKLTAWLMPWPDGVRAYRTGPFSTPWRTVVIGESAGDLADSRIALNLNEPNKIGDVSWFTPGKYVGVWWEMHLRRSTWASGDRHGATTENVKRYIDFAAKYGFSGVLVEGWNKGWDGDWLRNGHQISFTEPYPDFDLRGLADYANSKGVRLIGHHETAGAIVNYESQLDEAFSLYAGLGVNTVKTGYVEDSGDIKDAEGGKHWFAAQYMVRHHLKVVETAARYHIAINAHEPVKDTGLRRTYPNWVSREAARGQEFNAWGRPTNRPDHLTILPFTRLLAGPMDYTPGIFDIENGKSVVTERLQATIANQLALYVVIYSPVQMAADLPEHYEARPDALRFILDVPADWENSKTLAGEIGDYVVVARQQREGKDWFLGAVTDEEERSIQQSLGFLTPGKRYEAQIYRDADDADYRTNPTALTIEKKVVTAKDSLGLVLKPGGGVAVRFKALD